VNNINFYWGQGRGEKLKIQIDNINLDD